jgi:hypothetical protein
MSSVYIRAGDPNFTLVMVDGIPLNDAMNPRGGSVDLSLIDLIDAERIEVVRERVPPKGCSQPCSVGRTAAPAGRRRRRAIFIVSLRDCPASSRSACFPATCGWL